MLLTVKTRTAHHPLKQSLQAVGRHALRAQRHEFFARAGSASAATSSRFILTTADEEAVRIECLGDEIDAITRFDPLTGHGSRGAQHHHFFPAKQFVTPADKLNRALTTIRAELDQIGSRCSNPRTNYWKRSA